jgi:hypothetical protein
MVGKEKDTRLPLGPYQEALRLYLLGKTGIPDGVVQLVMLSAVLDELHNRVSAMPWLFERETRVPELQVHGDRVHFPHILRHDDPEAN